MPTKRLIQFDAWSHSRKSDYDKCPRLAKHKHLDKIREPSNAAMQNGTRVHSVADSYIQNKLKVLPKELKLFAEEFKHLRKIRSQVELEKEMAVTKAWAPTGWFDHDAWCRAKIDCGYVTDDGVWKIIDFKTGKVRPEKTQLDLYAAVAVRHARQDVVLIDAELWFLDWGEIVPARHTIDEAMALSKVFDKSVKKMFSDRTFKPSPGRNCGWCWFGQAGKKKGGPGLCKF